MKQHLTDLFSTALAELVAHGVVPEDAGTEIRFERSRQEEHGDLATNLAMILAKPARRSPRDLAQALIDVLPASPYVARLEVAGPGFINIFLHPAAHFAVLQNIFKLGDRYGQSNDGAGQRILLEFVSANPTGPLHVGHGRGAAYGDALARILRATGHRVTTEYYVNDSGRQMDILALSVWLRYLELCGDSTSFPERCYQGDYIFDIAASVHRECGERYRHDVDEMFEKASGLDDEAHLDALIAGAKKVLERDGYQRFFTAALNTIIDDIRSDLRQFNVEYDNWFSERSLHEDQSVAKAIKELKQTRYLYQKDGAWWFRARDFGDEKDRVVLRENNAPTYFAADIAYHLNKFERGFDRLIDIWGADHHGYIERVKGAMQALNQDPDKLHIALVQFAVLYRSGKKISMSTRSGEFVTLRELREEVGTDAARFFYVQRKAEQHMDFDLDLAKSQSSDNPVYYVQYAYARICSVFDLAADRKIDLSHIDTADMSLLKEKNEIDLAVALGRFPEVLSSASQDLEPHQVVYYLRELANGFHTYYNAHRFLDVEPALRDARLALIGATRQVLANGLRLIGVSTPETM